MSGMIASPRRLLAWRLGLLVLILVVIVALLFGPYRFLTGTVAGSADQGPRPAPCLPGEEIEILDSPHISEADLSDVEYNSLPPTSGPHFPFSISPGIYDTAISEGLTIHAMEHGHVVVQYAPAISDDELAALERLAGRYGADVILAPYPPLTAGIALTAWGRIHLLDRYDERRITAFVEALRGRYNHGWTTDDDCG